MDKQTGEAIARALKENWGLREVKQGPGRPGARFKKTAKQLTVYFDRLDALSAAIAAQNPRGAFEVLGGKTKRAALPRLEVRQNLLKRRSLAAFSDV